ncbi:hypothetical protein H2O64_02690 [Kordia sp. YSTF-M3]|uniref:DUF4386 family protein n=1 Tax=Kordia aestuariivivens TaxID=2759037 RepID=A0ABR7Q4W2_9FLAO|nr:hypothetical protein [Kordia aestuariivivens]MBC8753562.1 hypothetical protein [Kordia aestuariivivens]
MIKSAIQILKVSTLMGLLTNILNVTLFSLYPKYLAREEMNIATLENEFVSDLLNVKYILFYLVLWIVISGLYYLMAKLRVIKLYRTIILSVLFVALIAGTTSVGYMLHLLGYVLFVIFSAVTFTAFYLLIEKEISKASFD